MTHSTSEAPRSQTAGTVTALRALLVQQSRTIRSLSGELADSYQKELVFFDNLESRDRELQEQERRFLKKIWWLESELRAERERAGRAEAERDAIRERYARLTGVLPRPVRSLVRRVRKAVGSWQ